MLQAAAELYTDKPPQDGQSRKQETHLSSHVELTKLSSSFVAAKCTKTPQHTNTPKRGDVHAFSNLVRFEALTNTQSSHV